MEPLIQTLEGHIMEVISAVFSPNGKLVTSASSDKTVRSWDTPIGKQCEVLEGHLYLIYSLPHGALVASAPWDNTARL